MQRGFSNLAQDDGTPMRTVEPFRLQLLKWIGNKQRFAHEIVGHFPPEFGTYYEPFLGSGAVLGTLTPKEAVAGDVLEPLIEIWMALKDRPEQLKKWYTDRWQRMMASDREKKDVYEEIKESFNQSPNGPDLLMIARSCYGGVIRFRQNDGYLSTPCGSHDPITPESFAKRVNEWHPRVQGTEFVSGDFESVMDRAEEGNLVYCDPPYSETQRIVYGAHSFGLERLFRTIRRCKERGVYVALSIDGTKKSGNVVCDVPIPEGLFEHEAVVDVGRSKLRRFQREGDTLEDEEVSDRLLLTY